MSRRVLIVGYYGFDNSGDDAILKSICDDVANISPSVEIGVLSKNPEKTKKEYEVEAYNRFSLPTVIKAIRKCDVLVMGGGTLIQELSSTKSMYYYLGILQMAKVMGKKIMLYSNGIGPINKSSSKRLTKLVLNQVDLITLRESLSLKLLKELGVNKPELKVTADPVFNLSLEIKETEITDKPYVVVMVRPWKSEKAYVKPIAKVCDYIYETYGKQIVFVPMKYPMDLGISKEIMGEMTNEAILLERLVHEEEMFGMIKNSDLVIAMRLHALIYGAIQNTPMVGIEYDPKIAYYLEEMAMPLAGDIYHLDAHKMTEMVDQIFRQYDHYKTSLSKQVLLMQKKGEMNIKSLEKLLK